MDANLNEKLFDMASNVHRGVVMPADLTRDDGPVSYERRRLNYDGTWKEHRYMNGLSPNQKFHFLEYTSKNSRNPLDIIQ